MATVNVARCSGGGHIHITVKETGHSFSLSTADIQSRNYDALNSLDVADADLVLQMIQVVKTVSEPKTAAKIKNAVEAATFEYMDPAR